MGPYIVQFQDSRSLKLNSLESHLFLYLLSRSRTQIELTGPGSHLFLYLLSSSRTLKSQIELTGVPFIFVLVVQIRDSRSLKLNSLESHLFISAVGKTRIKGIIPSENKRCFYCLHNNFLSIRYRYDSLEPLFTFLLAVQCT